MHLQQILFIYKEFQDIELLHTASPVHTAKQRCKIKKSPEIQRFRDFFVISRRSKIADLVRLALGLNVGLYFLSKKSNKKGLN